MAHCQLVQADISPKGLQVCFASNVPKLSLASSRELWPPWCCHSSSAGLISNKQTDKVTGNSSQKMNVRLRG
ncbi:TPA: hypothetical protein ACH3X3_005282 [Trebouxia sp. C0006]